jgi:hypothetical protein
VPTQLPLQQSVSVLQGPAVLAQQVEPSRVVELKPVAPPRHSSPLQQSLAVPQGPPPPTQPHRPLVPQSLPQQSLAAAQLSPSRPQQVPTPRLAVFEQSEPAQQSMKPVKHSLPAQPDEPPPVLPPISPPIRPPMSPPEEPPVWPPLVDPPVPFELLPPPELPPAAPTVPELEP